MTSSLKCLSILACFIKPEYLKMSCKPFVELDLTNLALYSEIIHHRPNNGPVQRGSDVEMMPHETSKPRSQMKHQSGSTPKLQMSTLETPSGE